MHNCWTFLIFAVHLKPYMRSIPKDFSHLDKIALNKDAWAACSDQEIQMMVFRHCIFYGTTKNRELIPNLFDLYEYLCQRSTSQQRIKMLTALASNLRKNNPKASLAIFPFIQVEEDGEVIRIASQFYVNISVIDNKNFAIGTNSLVELIKNQITDRRNAYILLGLLDIDNEQITDQVGRLKQHLNNEIISILHNNGAKFE